MNPERELRLLYAKLPKLDCKGLCAECCGPIAATPHERRRIERRAGKKLEAPPPTATCSMLSAVGRCTVYGDRPFICRLWGVVASMKCPHGCVPEGGFLTHQEGARLHLEAERIGGKPSAAETARLMQEMASYRPSRPAVER